MTKLSDVHPGSLPNAFVGTDDLQHLFLGEGGQIAFIDMAAAPTGGGAQLMPDATKVIQIGALGALPAELLLDPGQHVDLDGNGDFLDDTDDLIYIAAGQMGLWAMEANPDPLVQNRVIRIDDRGNASGPTTLQRSRRFCNQLEIVQIGPERFLAATFARKERSVLRLYRLSDIHALFHAAASETGSELNPFLQVHIGKRTDVPPGQSEKSFGRSYALGMTVDQEEAADVNGESADLYVAMNTGGLVKVSLDAGTLTSAPRPPWLPPGPPLTIVDSIDFTKTWGPVFGDGTSYSTPVLGTVKNSSGYPAAWYENLKVYDPTRTARFNDLARDDAPAFVDSVVQDTINSAGERQHYLYAAVDHLNWVRFDLDLHAWGPNMLIDHHEGAPQPVRSTVDWRIPTGGTSNVTFDGGGREHVRPINMPSTFNSSGMEIPFTGFLYARRLCLIEPPAGSASVEGPLLVSTCAGSPFFVLSDVFAPRSAYTHSFYGVGGVPLQISQAIGSKRVAVIVYDTATINSLTYPTEAVHSEIGYHEVGGGVLWAPKDQSGYPNPDEVQILHDGTAAINSILIPPMETQGVCLSTFEFGAWFQDEPQDFFLRNELDVPGRYTFSVGWSELDPNVIYTGINDNKQIQHDGALRTVVDSSGDLVIEPVGPAPPAGVFPSGSTGDLRMVMGLAPKDDCQWIDPDSSTTSWFVGRAEDVDAPGQSLILWGLFKVEIDLGIPSVVQDKTWFIGYAQDRWGRTGRGGGYDTATTTPAEYSDWIEEQVGGTAPRSLAFYCRAGTPDSIEVVNRQRLVDTLAGEPDGSGSPELWDPTWSLVSFNGHPEYDPMPNTDRDLVDGMQAPSGPTDEFEAAQDWWAARDPVINEAANTLAWGGECVFFPPTTAAPDGRWVFVSPCFYLSNSSALAPKNPMGDMDLDNDFAAWFSTSELSTSPRHQELMDNFDHGFIQFWDISNPEDLEATDALDPAVGFQPIDEYTELQFGYPRGSSRMPWIIFPDAGSSAFELESFVFDTEVGPRVMLACADFGGSVLVYDITDVPDMVPATLVAQWSAPERFYDEARHFLPGSSSPGRQVGIVWSIAVDDESSSEVAIYAGVHDYGIVPLVFKDRLAGPGEDLGFLPDPVRVETAGNPFALRLRPASPGVEKALIVSDGIGGLRLYVEED
ncbi:MAG: hypothetical protein AAGA20_12475 [Planctomycetota bacterium]